MGDIEKVVKKYLGDEEIIFEGNVDVSGIKIAKGKAKAALFVNEFDDMKLGLLDEGTKLIVVVPNRDWYVRNPEGRDWEIKDDKYVLREWNFDPVSGELRERIIVPGESEKEIKTHAYAPGELKALLEKMNFKVEAVFTDVGRERYDPNKPSLYAYAVKLAESKEEVPVETIEPEEVVLEEIAPEEVEKEKLTGGRKTVGVAATGTATTAAVAAKESKIREEEEIYIPKRRGAAVSRGEMPGVYGLRLKWLDSNKKEHEIEVDKDIIIGRGRGDVLTMVNKMGKKKYTPMMVFDYDKKISRKHIEIVKKDGKWYLRDLGSTNGTALNGIPLPGWKKPSGGNRYPSEEVLLRDGDIITLANTITIQANVYLKEAAEPAKMASEQYVEPEERVERSLAPVATAGSRAAREAPSEVEERKDLSEEVFGEDLVEDESGELVEEKVEEVPAPTCLLKWVDGNLRPHEVEITDDIYIGKRKDNNVVFLRTMDGKVTIPLGIIDLENEISERHLEIHKENGKWYIRDLGSERGTIVRGDYLPGWSKGKPSEYLELKDDDEILLGKYLITVKIQ